MQSHYVPLGQNVSSGCAAEAFRGTPLHLCKREPQQSQLTVRQLLVI